MWHKFRELLAHPLQKNFIIILIISNLLGSIYGYYWYREQLASTPARFLLFVPDSPFSTTLFMLMLIIILMGKRFTLLELLACAGVIKYGIWAAIINIHFGLTSGIFTVENFGLTVSHLGMALEGFIFIRHVKLPKSLIGVTFLWMLLNDFMDYFVQVAPGTKGVHPYLFADNQWGIALWSVILLTVLITLYYLYLGQTREKAC